MLTPAVRSCPVVSNNSPSAAAWVHASLRRLRLVLLIFTASLLAACPSSSLTGLSITSWSPTTISADSGAFTLTVNGTGFMSSVVVMNGQAIPTLTISDTKLTADVPATLTATPGTLTFFVTDLSPAGNSTTAADGLITVMSTGPAPDLAISKSHTGSFVQGQGATYTIGVSNLGTGTTTGQVTVSDTLPAGLTATGTSGTGWVCTTGATVTCTRSDALTGGASYPTITLTVHVATNAPAGVTNTATVTTPGDSNSANDVASDATVINAPAVPVLTVLMTHAGSFTQGQIAATYSVTVSNSGTASTAGTVQAAVTLPSPLTSPTAAGTGWVCMALTCTRSDALAANTSYPVITVTVNVASNAPATVTPSVTVTGGSATNANNSATDPTTVQPSGGAGALTVTKTHIGNFAIGANGTYTITVTNGGSTATVGMLSVSDSPPGVMTPVAMAGTGWTCDINALTCTWPTPVAPGATLNVITFTVGVSPTATAGTVTNFVSAFDSGTNSASGSDPTILH